MLVALTVAAVSHDVTSGPPAPGPPHVRNFNNFLRPRNEISRNQSTCTVIEMFSKYSMTELKFWRGPVTVLGISFGAEIQGHNFHLNIVTLKKMAVV